MYIQLTNACLNQTLWPECIVQKSQQLQYVNYEKSFFYIPIIYIIHSIARVIQLGSHHPGLQLHQSYRPRNAASHMVHHWMHGPKLLLYSQLPTWVQHQPPTSLWWQDAREVRASCGGVWWWRTDSSQQCRVAALYQWWQKVQWLGSEIMA